jgi:phage portal protein BeeE
MHLKRKLILFGAPAALLAGFGSIIGLSPVTAMAAPVTGYHAITTNTQAEAPDGAEGSKAAKSTEVDAPGGADLQQGADIQGGADVQEGLGA